MSSTPLRTAAIPSPPVEGYRELTEADALASRPTVKKEITVKQETTAVMPSAVLEGSDSEISDTEYVSPRFSLPHLQPHCIISGPASSQPIKIRPLIDSGCPTALIRPDLADALGLHRHSLARPEPSGSAWDAEGRDGPMLREWVKLRIMSPGRKWVSRSVVAKVAPNLCTQLILGLPFLARNKLVLDAASRTLIQRKTRFDLMNNVWYRAARPAKATIEEIEDEDRAKEREIRNSRPKDYDPDTAPLMEPIDPVFDPVLHSHLSSLNADLRSHVMAAVKSDWEETASEEHLRQLDVEFREEYAALFNNELPHVDTLPKDVYHRIRLKDPSKEIVTRSYSCPRKYRDKWKNMLDRHIAAGRLRPSSSPFASPAFLVPKSKTDLDAEPRWVNDYRQLNSNTIRDRTPLPKVEEILADCGQGKYFSLIDMTSAFFQTPIHPDDIPLTAISTPFGLFEWTVMPQGGCNGPATHQRRMYQALKHLIGKCCHVYIDDIIVYSRTLREHIKHLRLVLDALLKMVMFPRENSLVPFKVL